jgi:RNA polymerase sigma factor (TIGR02999 family)
MAKERPGQTLQATALVHEAYVRLVGRDDPEWDNRGHYFAAAAEAMRRILIERARKKARLKRGGQDQRVTFDEVLAGEDRPEQLIALDEALDRLEGHDEMMAQVVKLKYFGGLSVKETASALGVSSRTVNRQWTAARAWLFQEMQEVGSGAAASA